MSDYLFAVPSAAIDVRYSISMFVWYYPLSDCNGPIINYQGPAGVGYGVHLWATLGFGLQVQ